MSLMLGLVWFLTTNNISVEKETELFNKANIAIFEFDQVYSHDIYT